MRLWRLTRAVYADLSGEGAQRLADAGIHPDDRWSIWLQKRR
jgi:hypothetical protein